MYFSIVGVLSFLSESLVSVHYWRKCSGVSLATLFCKLFVNIKHLCISPFPDPFKVG